MFTVKQQTGSRYPKETITHHFSVSGIGQKKLSMQPKLWRQKMLLKQKPSKHSVNGLFGFITLGIYTPQKRVCIVLHYCSELPIDMGNSICTAH